MPIRNVPSVMFGAEREEIYNPATSFEGWSNCSTPMTLRDRWFFIDEARTTLRIRRKSFVFKDPGNEILRYKCVQNKGNTYLLRIQGIDLNRDGIVCIGFAPVHDHPTAEYRIWRLSQSVIGHRIMAPQEIPGSIIPPNINHWCKGAHLPVESYIQRSEPGCKFPHELRTHWQTSLQIAWRLSFSKTELSFVAMNRTSYRFRCERRDKEFYLLRSFNMLPGQDGILCLNIVQLPTDPFYDFKMSRTNSGNWNSLEGMVLLVDRGLSVRLYEDCDWLDSPARPEFLYRPQNGG
ncbi:hypothetical protein FSP39_006415 [Pinctada imbricata]|uniref:Uncharacterized protein n=1 Tax=Pinctada imbricata TaxID=66713 RepID=A0AA88YAZ5_PINIB|nr:hypothetical protein FSP39_006415 [Pinctada imbricata]